MVFAPVQMRDRNESSPLLPRSTDKKKEFLEREFFRGNISIYTCLVVWGNRFIPFRLHIIIHQRSGVFILTIWEGEELFLSTYAHAHPHLHTPFLAFAWTLGEHKGRYGAWDIGMRLRCMAAGANDFA